MLVGIFLTKHPFHHIHHHHEVVENQTQYVYEGLKISDTLFCGLLGATFTLTKLNMFPLDKPSHPSIQGIERFWLPVLRICCLLFIVYLYCIDPDPWWCYLLFFSLLFYKLFVYVHFNSLKWWIKDPFFPWLTSTLLFLTQYIHNIWIIYCRLWPTVKYILELLTLGIGIFHILFQIHFNIRARIMIDYLRDPIRKVDFTPAVMIPLH